MKRGEGKGRDGTEEGWIFDSSLFYQFIPDLIIYKCVHSHMHTNSFFLFNILITVTPFCTSHSIYTHMMIQNHGTFLIMHNPVTDALHICIDMHIYRMMQCMNICFMLLIKKNLLLKKKWNTVVAETVLLHYIMYPLSVRVM